MIEGDHAAHSRPWSRSPGVLTAHLLRYLPCPSSHDLHSSSPLWSMAFFLKPEGPRTARPWGKPDNHGQLSQLGSSWVRKWVGDKEVVDTDEVPVDKEGRGQKRKSRREAPKERVK